MLSSPPAPQRCEGRCGGTRRTLAFSRNMENHAAQVALFMYAYNFVHRTARSPGGVGRRLCRAMAAGVSDWRMRMEDVVAMLDTEYEAKRAA